MIFLFEILKVFYKMALLSAAKSHIFNKINFYLKKYEQSSILFSFSGQIRLILNFSKVGWKLLQNLLKLFSPSENNFGIF
jgi:hypothetical protein